MASARLMRQKAYIVSLIIILKCAVVKCLYLFLECMYGADGIRLHLGEDFLVGGVWYVVLGIR